jgi:SH3 domain protein
MILAFCLVFQRSWAQKAYVTDSFKITLRTGPSTNNKIITMLASGQPVEVLEPGDEWSRVRLLEGEGGGLEGWLLSRYLVNRLPWELQTANLKEINQHLKVTLKKVEDKLEETLRREKEIKEDLKEKSDTLEKSEREYEELRSGSQNYLALKAEHGRVLSSLQRSQNELQRLAKENETLRSSQTSRWFKTGALVLLCGLMIGLIMGRQQKKRSSLY